jgi:aspartyl protease family protein
MRIIIIFAAGLLLIGGLVAKFADQAITAHSAAPAPAASAPAEPPQVAGASRSLILSGDRNGHFQVDATVDGRRIGFVVDTGASLVILRETDAARVGIRPMAADYSATVSTANGKIKAAPAKLERIEVGGITVRDVAALVLPDDVLSQNLLGVSFLSRLKRYEYANGRMVLEQ